MKAFSRREMLKTSLLAPAVAVAAHGMTPIEAAMQAATEPVAGPLSASGAHAAPPLPSPAPAASGCCSISAGAFISAMPTIPRRILDSAAAERAISRRPATFFPPAPSPSTTAIGSPSICRTTGPSSCLSRTTPRSSAKDFIRSGATIPTTSVGWYRRVFEIPAADAGKRITIEFDGAYRETMVVFNGFYIGRHSGGYDPFQLRRDRLRQSRRQKCAAGARGRHAERRLVLRGRGHLSPRLARSRPIRCT